MALEEERSEKQERGVILKRLEQDFTETEKVILNRRSVRWYKKEQVPEFMVKRIIEAGRFAPSAANCQPWKFVVVREPWIIDDLTKSVVMICKLFKAILEYRTPGNFWKFPIAKLYIHLMPQKLHPVPFSAISLIADGKLKVYHGAPTVILIFKDVRGVSNPDLDCGIAGQNMALAAHSMGLGTCWVSFSKVAFDYLGFKWNRVFGIRYPYKFASSLALGWPMGSPNGFVDRPVHNVNWYENGRETVVDTNRDGSHIGLSERFTVPSYLDPLKTCWGQLSFDYARCNGCGICERICPASSIVMEDKKPGMSKEGLCMACGDCMAICPKDAIRIESSFRFAGRFKTVDSGDLKLPRLK